MSTILNAKAETFKRSGYTQTKSFLIYRQQMLRLLAYPKPAFAQLVIGLPMLMGFRSQEITSWRAEWLDLQYMNTFVLDCKRKELFTVPLNLYMAQCAEEVLNGRDKGLVLGSRSNRNRSKQISPTAIWYIWKKWVRLARLPNAKDIHPLTGRQYFACEWVYGQELPIVTLQMIMRHTHYETTASYVKKLLFFEDLKRDFNRFQTNLMKLALEEFQFTNVNLKSEEAAVAPKIEA